MNHRTHWVQQVIGSILVTVLTGCAAPATPPALPTSTEAPAAEIRAAPTQRPTSSFEQCVALGNPVQNAYPRQCTSDDGKIFKEALEEGVLFSQTYGGSGDETAHFIISTKDGGFLITGTINDTECLVLKLDALHEEEWQATFGESLGRELQFSNAWFRCWSARQTSDRGFVIMGTARSESAEKRFLLELDQNGTWLSAEIIPEHKEKFAYLGPDGKIIWLNSFNLLSTVIETSDDDYALIGTFRRRVPDAYTRIIKTDSRGIYLWEKNLCLDKKLQRDWQKTMVCSNHYSWNAIQSQDGGYVLAGGSGNRIGLVKTDADGNIEWLQSYSASAASALLQTADGGFLIAGQRRGNGILIKTDETGKLQWSKPFGGDQEDAFLAMEQRPNGEVIVLGGTKSFGGGAEDIWLLGIDVAALKE